MKIGILCIGNEILKGSTLNKNLSIIGKKLFELGIPPVAELVVPDEKISITNAISWLYERSDCIITTGGLGPTSDDITKQSVAEYFRMKLVEHKDTAEKIKEYLAKINRKDFPVSVFNQAMIPERAKIIPNDFGTAPGVQINENNKLIYMLPGPPREMEPMLDCYVIPDISLYITNRVYSKTLALSGIPESVAEEKIKELFKSNDNINVAYCASVEGLTITLTSPDKENVEKTMFETRRILEKYALPDGIRDIYEEIFRLCKEKNIRLALAESCTGGAIASSMTNYPGISEIFEGSVVCYSNKWKKQFLGVSEETLKKYGAVSKECALEMVENIARSTGAQASVSVTGIAGPGGGTQDKPVGLVFIGISYLGKSSVYSFNFSGGRENIRKRTSATALTLLRDAIILNK